MTNPFGKKTEAKDIDDIHKILDKKTTVEEEPVETEVVEDFKPLPVEKIKDEQTKNKVKKLKLRAKRKAEKNPFNWNRGLLFLCMLGIMGIIFFYQMTAEVSMSIALVLMLFGMLCFLPLGLLFGKLFLDPYVRCKVLRRVRGKNYGMVYFVHKGGQRVDIRIKNLDDDVVVQGTKLWVLEKAGIYYTDIDDAYIKHATISDASIVTSPNNVPILFLDAESMLPLRFFETKTKSNPQQVGATTLGYVNNQIAKNLFFKRSMQTFYVLMLVLQAINITGLIMLYDALVGL